MSNAFSNIVHTLCSNSYHKQPITKKDYEDFCHGYLFDAVRGLTLGQAFCYRFNVIDNFLLYTLKSEESAKEHILKSGYVVF